MIFDDSEHAYEHYKRSNKLAKKHFRKCLSTKKSPYLEVLDDIVNVEELSIEYIGEIDVPANLIVGTKTQGRMVSFASNFLPLLGPHTEFANKWMRVCNYHLSETGITDPPTAYEYLGKFYIEEGNKRVSVLKSYGSVLITLSVKRLHPKRSDLFACRFYDAFLEFYKLSKLYSIQFSKPEYYKKLLEAMEYPLDYEFSRRDRINLIGFFERLTYHLEKKHIYANPSDCLLAMMEIYGKEKLYDIKDVELDKAINEHRFRLLEGHGYYNILVVSDEENDSLYSGNINNLKDLDFIVSCGDLKSEYLEYLVTMTNKPLFYVRGNHDDRINKRDPEGCICVDDDLIIYKNIRILGLGGSYRYSNDKYQYTDKEMHRRIRKLKRKIRKAGGVDIVVTHAPIKGIGDLDDIAHSGFESFKEILDGYHPKLWFYGHVHLNYKHSLNRVHEHKGTLIINGYDKFQTTL